MSKFFLKNIHVLQNNSIYFKIVTKGKQKSLNLLMCKAVNTYKG